MMNFEIQSSLLRFDIQYSIFDICSALVAAMDKELWFGTHLDGREVKAKFDLGRMMYKGKLEF
jgi:hypothetical protein